MSDIEPPWRSRGSRTQYSATSFSDPTVTLVSHRVWYSPDYDKSNWLVGLVNTAALWYVPPHSSLNDSFVDISPIAVVGSPTRSTFTPDVTVPSFSTPSPVSSRSPAPVPAEPGNNSSSAVCYLTSIWMPEHPRSPSLPAKTSAPIRGGPVTSWLMWVAFGIFLEFAPI